MACLAGALGVTAAEGGLDEQYSFTDIFKAITTGLGAKHADAERQEKLHIIGAGLSRTGTTSVALALEHLGYKVYDTTAAVPLGHLQLMKEAFIVDREKGVDVLNAEILRNGFNATLDAPVALLWKELLERQPDAKVLLTVRDSAEQWFQSYERHYNLFSPVLGLPFNKLVDFSFSTRFQKQYDCLDEYQFWTPWYFPWIDYLYKVDRDVKRCIHGYSEYIEHVKRQVPRDQLLVFNVKEGWEPLCAFLGKRVPEIPFPHVNTKADVALGYYVIRFIALLYPFLIAAPIVTLYYCSKYLFCRSKGRKIKGE